MLALALAGSTHNAMAQTVDPKLWAVDSYRVVLSIARSPTTIYLAGNFSSVGPVSGQGVPVDITAGAPLPAYPRVSGTVEAVVADGRGGWYIGGSFDRVGGEERRGLAHILANGTVAPWAPAVVGTIQALALSNDTLYVGGDFVSIEGANRGNGAAFAVATGILLDWDPQADAVVFALAVGHGVVYLGGRFQHLGAEQRPGLGAADRDAGAPTNWNPQASATVRAIAVDGDAVFVGGAAVTETDALLAAIDPATGAVLPWPLSVERQPVCSRCDGGPFVRALAVSGGRLYVAGSFTHVGGQARLGMASIDLATHAVTDWNPLIYGPAPLPYCYALAVRGNVVYVGGQFYGLEQDLKM